MTRPANDGYPRSVELAFGYYATESSPGRWTVYAEASPERWGVDCVCGHIDESCGRDDVPGWWGQHEHCIESHYAGRPIHAIPRSLGPGSARLDDHHFPHLADAFLAILTCDRETMANVPERLRRAAWAIANGSPSR